jgi:methyl coenzyme M reductase beta subunit
MKFFTFTSLALAIVGAGLVAVQGAWTEDRFPSGLAPSKIVTGDVTLDIVDKSYVITSQAGKEVRLELDDNTKVQNRVNPGDKVEAKISSKGHTLSVTRLER